MLSLERALFCSTYLSKVPFACWASCPPFSLKHTIQTPFIWKMTGLCHVSSFASRLVVTLPKPIQKAMFWVRTSMNPEPPKTLPFQTPMHCTASFAPKKRWLGLPHPMRLGWAAMTFWAEKLRQETVLWMDCAWMKDIRKDLQQSRLPLKLVIAIVAESLQWSRPGYLSWHFVLLSHCPKDFFISSFFLDIYLLTIDASVGRCLMPRFS